jgi:hypothetical protein
MERMKELRLFRMVRPLQTPHSANSLPQTGAQQQIMHAVDCMAAHKPITAVVSVECQRSILEIPGPVILT